MARASITASKKRSAGTRSSVRARKNGRQIVRLPYVRKVSQRGPISVWQVDGSYVRTHTDEEFTNFGHHYTFKYIPKDEFWIDQGVSKEETGFYIKHLAVEHRLMKRGVDEKDAREQAGRAEEKERERAGDVRKMTRGGRILPEPAQVHKRLWKKLENGVTVWIINGRLVRSVFDDDFTEGGHDHVYAFIPENEVWIDDTLKAAERPYALVHELHERNLMLKGKTYERAHAESSKLERRLRRNPKELHEALADEGWE